MNSLSNNEKYYQSNSLDGIDTITDTISSTSLLIDGTNFMMADLDAGGHNVKNMANGIALDDAVTLGQLVNNYVDLTSNQTIGGIKSFSNQVNFNGVTKTNLTLQDIPNGTSRQAITTGTQTITGVKTWSNSAIFNGNLTTNGPNVNIQSTNFTVASTTITNLNNGATCNNKKISNVLDPNLAQDVATKNYVDTHISNPNYVLKTGDVMTGNLTINNVLNLNAGTANDIDVDSANETNTYIRFGEAGATSDFAYLRQIGPSDSINLSFDFHDNINDGQFLLRNVRSSDNPDTTRTFFTSSSIVTNVYSNSFSVSSSTVTYLNNGANCGNKKLTNVLDPTLAQDAATKNYVDTQTSNPNYVLKTGDVMTGNLGIGPGIITPQRTLDVDGNARIKTNLDVSGNINLKDGQSLYIGSADSVIPYGFRVHYNTAAGNVAVLDFSGSSLFIRKKEGATDVIKFLIDANNIKAYVPIVPNAWSSCDLIQTKILNQSTSGTGVNTIGAGGSSDWLFPTITLKNTVITTSRIVINFDAPYYLTGQGTDTIELNVYDTTGGTGNFVYRKSQYYDGNGGGGTRSSPLFPFTFSHTPSQDTSNVNRTYTISLTNRTNDTLRLCQGVINNVVTNLDYYTIEIKEIKI